MDVPYEVRMKYIIQADKKDQEKWAKLSKYIKHLEGEVINRFDYAAECGEQALIDTTPFKSHLWVAFIFHISCGIHD